MIRQPAVAGQFYNFDPQQLMKQVEECTDKKAQKTEVLGAVCPHAGYIYSGRVAGAVFSRMKSADTYVIIGPNHTGLGMPFSIMTEGVWNMPFGQAMIDSILAGEILKNSRFLEPDPMAHAREHSVEVQVPFVQYFAKDAQIVPIVVAGSCYMDELLEACRDIGEAIAKAVGSVNEKIVIIASSDLTHYEPQDEAKRKDMQAINAIVGLDEEKLFARVRELDITMCGYAPVAVMLSACKKLGAKKACLVKYETSGDVTKDYGQVVGYGGILVL